MGIDLLWKRIISFTSPFTLLLKKLDEILRGRLIYLTVNATQINPALKKVQKWVSCAQYFVVAN